MICNSCKREIKDPLVLFDGRLICPKCNKSIIVTNQKFKVTEENDELYKQSEILFLKLLPELNEKDYKEYSNKKSLVNKELDKVINLCNKAAMADHPSAVYRLGYYYEKSFIDANLPEDYRFKIAYNYYTSLLKSEQSEIESVKLRAANSLNDMLASLGNGKKTSSLFDYNRNYDEFFSRYGDEIIRYESIPQDTVSSIADVVMTYAQELKKRPILGFFYLRLSELKNLIKELAVRVGGVFVNGEEKTYSLKKITRNGKKSGIMYVYYPGEARKSLSDANTVNAILDDNEEKDVILEYQARGYKFADQVFIRSNDPREEQLNRVDRNTTNFELMVKNKVFLVFTEDDEKYCGKKIALKEYLKDALPNY